MRSRLLVASAFLLVCMPLLLMPARPATLEGLALRPLLAGVHAALLAARPAADASGAPTEAHPLDPDRNVAQLRLHWPAGDPKELEEHRDALRSALRIAEISESDNGNVIAAALPDLAGSVALDLKVVVAADAKSIGLQTLDGVVVRLDAGSAEPASNRMGRPAALLPPLLAIFLAFLLRRTVPSLFLGVLLGAFLIAQSGGSVLATPKVLFLEIIWGEILNDSFLLYILGFVLLLSATIAVVTRMGGIEGMVRGLLRFARSSRSVQGVAYALGLAVFFDDYANTIVVGNSAAPLTDRLRVSRAKLAYIVDSTAAPVAGIALLSTWVAYQISTYAPQLPTIGMSQDQGYSLFIETIPYRFYCIFALITVAATIALRREIGPMAAVEAAARQGHDTSRSTSGVVGSGEEIAAGAVPWWFNGVLPIFTMIAMTGALIYWSGASSVAAAAADGDAGAALAREAGGMEYARAVLNSADSTWAIFYGSLAALLLALALGLGQRLLRVGDAAVTAAKGLVGLKEAVAILVLAWTIGAVCRHLGTAEYLVAASQDLMSPQMLPVVLFVTSCFVAFATGSSWATMAIMQPNVVLLAHRLGSDSELGAHGLLVLCIGSVLEGSIFGDHCSPISDTTILSSTASGCRHLDHVRTQAPYALLCAAVAILLGYVPTAFFGTSPWISLGVGALTLFAVLLVGGRDPEATGATARA
ncbi:MAG TPA: Na+/H+ antiporter NhaC family protein [Planctomycetota bacterium]